MTHKIGLAAKNAKHAPSAVEVSRKGWETCGGLFALLGVLSGGQHHRCPVLREILLQVVVAVVTALMVAGCTPFGDQTSETGGTGSEIVGKSEYDSTGQAKTPVTNATTGLPVISGRVFVYQRSSVPDTSWATIGAAFRAMTDNAGYFHIYDAPPGLVVVEVNDGSGMGIAGTIDIDRDSSVFDMGTLVAVRTGEIRVRAQTSLPGNVRFYMGVEGTRLIVRGTQAGVDIVLGDVPTGVTYTVNIRVYEPIAMQLRTPGITVSPGFVTTLQTLQIE